MSDSNANPVLGRWATLGEAARIFDVEPEKLLKQLKRGKRRGTQIGNNWFAYIDPETEATAGERDAAASGDTPGQAAAIEELQQQNAELREAVARLEEGDVPEAPAAEAPAETGRERGVDLMPLVDRIAELHQSSQAEIEFLRSELKAVREQHADEMRRKDILLQQAHKSLQQAVQAHRPQPLSPPRVSGAEIEKLRRERTQTTRLLRDMSSLMAVMYRQIKNP